MTKAGSLLLLLTAIVAALAGILAFAVSKFFSAARSTARAGREGGAETHGYLRLRSGLAGGARAAPGDDAGTLRRLTATSAWQATTAA